MPGTDMCALGEGTAHYSQGEEGDRPSPPFHSPDTLWLGFLPPWLASLSHQGTSYWSVTSETQLLPSHSTRRGVPVSPRLLFPGELRHQSQHKSHIKASAISQIKKTKPNWTQTQSRRHPRCEGPRGPSRSLASRQDTFWYNSGTGARAPLGNGSKKIWRLQCPWELPGRAGTNNLSQFFLFLVPCLVPTGLLPGA